MFDFIDRFLNIALPRTRDFRGLRSTSIDNMGNYTVGVKEHVIFPETTDEEIKDVFGLSVNFGVSSNNKEETKAFLEYIGFPIKKAGSEEEVKKVRKSRSRAKKE
jgi:large subunit ribosomal protein L5